MSRAFRAINPATGAELEGDFLVATATDVERAASDADAAFRSYGRLAASARAAFLRGIAAELEVRRDELVARADAETALGTARLSGELGRTTGQLAMFAAMLEGGSWLDARIDRADPERQPAPKPDLRSMRRPLGPVVVFGASNFPLAFSVAGGDTASALAAGCPVICKAHPSHPGTSRLAGEAILAAAAAHGVPSGVFALLFDDGHEVGQALVSHPLVKAVGFTGSRRGGDALMRLAAARSEPIPVYAEMGSINPQFILPATAATRGDAVADGLFASFTLGVGQFCTNPGVVLLPAGAAGDALRDRLAAATSAASPGVMLNEGICRNYGAGLTRLQEHGARLVARGGEGDGPAQAGVSLWEADLGAAPELLEEVFGPATLLLRYRDVTELESFARNMEGQLTVSLHGEQEELVASRALVEELEWRAGRLIVNQFPTGVEVSPAMVHGGPYPASSDGSTSVGTRAVERFTRFVAWQNFPQALLPEELRD